MRKKYPSNNIGFQRILPVLSSFEYGKILAKVTTLDYKEGVSIELGYVRMRNTKVTISDFKEFASFEFL